MSQVKNVLAGEGSNDVDNLRAKLSKLVKDNKDNLAQNSEYTGPAKTTFSPADLQVGATDKLQQMLVNSLADLKQKRSNNQAEQVKNERAESTNSTTNTGNDRPGKARGHDHATPPGQSHSSNSSSSSTQDRRYSQLKAIVDSIS
jgi:hypothetical protein